MQMGLAHKGREIMTDLTLSEVAALDTILNFCEEHEVNLVIKPPDTSNADSSWGIVLIGRKLGEKVEWGYSHNNLMFAGNNPDRAWLLRSTVVFCSSYQKSDQMVRSIKEHNERN